MPWPYDVPVPPTMSWGYILTYLVIVVLPMWFDLANTLGVQTTVWQFLAEFSFTLLYSYHSHEQSMFQEAIVQGELDIVGTDRNLEINQM